MSPFIKKNGFSSLWEVGCRAISSSVNLILCRGKVGTVGESTDGVGTVLHLSNKRSI